MTGPPPATRIPIRPSISQVAPECPSPPPPHSATSSTPPSSPATESGYSPGAGCPHPLRPHRKGWGIRATREPLSYLSHITRVPSHHAFAMGGNVQAPASHFRCCLFSSTHFQTCHPERSNSRIWRVTQSKDLRLSLPLLVLFDLPKETSYRPQLWTVSSSAAERRDPLYCAVIYMSLLLLAPQKKKDRAIEASGPGARKIVLRMTLRKTYAASGMLLLFTTRPAGIFFFNHTFALHRPKNGATATIPKAIAKAIFINISFCWPWKLPTRGEPAEQPMQPSVQLP